MLLSHFTLESQGQVQGSGYGIGSGVRLPGCDSQLRCLLAMWSWASLLCASATSSIRWGQEWYLLLKSKSVYGRHLATRRAYSKALTNRSRHQVTYPSPTMRKSPTPTLHASQRGIVWGCGNWCREILIRLNSISWSELVWTQRHVPSPTCRRLLKAAEAWMTGGWMNGFLCSPLSVSLCSPSSFTGTPSLMESHSFMLLGGDWGSLKYRIYCIGCVNLRLWSKTRLLDKIVSLSFRHRGSIVCQRDGKTSMDE